MSGSVRYGKKEIKEWIDKQKDIKTIVDFGCGEGTYPKLLGNKYYWIGIDIWEPYVEMFNLKEIYNKIIIEDISKVDLPKGDCAILGDVIEHLPKKIALKIFKKIYKNYKHIILSIPIGKYPSRESHCNKYTIHLSTWKFSEFGKYDWEIKFNVRSIGVFIK